MVTEAAANDAPVTKPIREIARGIAWLVGAAVAARFVETLVGRSPLGAALAGAVVVDLAMTRAGVRWDDHDDTNLKGSAARARRSIGIGVAVASVLVVVPVVCSVIVGAATISVGSPSMSLLFGLLRGAADGVRDELLYRGLPFYVAARAGVRVPIVLGYAALLGATPLMLMERLSWEALVLSLANGVLFGMLWVQTKSAWASVSAHAAWFFLAGIGLRGSIVEVSWKSGLLAENARTRGLPAIICVIVSILLTVFVSKKLAKFLEAPTGHAPS